MTRDKNWNLIPMREYPNLCVIREADGNIVATVQNKYASSVQGLPELLAASREVFETLKNEYPQWSENSSLGRLEKAIQKVRMTDEPL